MAEPPMRDPSLMHTRIRLHSSKTCMTIATAKLPGLIITSLISPHPTLTAIAFQYLIIMIGFPQCSHCDTALMLPHVIKSILISPKCSNDGEESGALTSPEHLSQEPHYIHDETSDAPANSDLTHIHGHGCVPENDVSISMDTEELVG